jgi:hypothetical protein
MFCFASPWDDDIKPTSSKVSLLDKYSSEYQKIRTSFVETFDEDFAPEPTEILKVYFQPVNLSSYNECFRKLGNVTRLYYGTTKLEAMKITNQGWRSSSAKQGHIFSDRSSESNSHCKKNNNYCLIVADVACPIPINSTTFSTRSHFGAVPRYIIVYSSLD